MTSEQIIAELVTFLSVAQVASLVDASESESDPAAWLADVLDQCRHNRFHLLI